MTGFEDEAAARRAAEREAVDDAARRVALLATMLPAEGEQHYAGALGRLRQAAERWRALVERRAPVEPDEGSQT